MLEKFLKEAVSNVLGKIGEDLVDILEDGKYINEFIIAKKLNLTINQTRNLLYRLSDNGLVSSTRKKDKKKGWFTYFWKIELLRSLEYLKGLKEKRIDQFKNQIKSRETKQFYVCERCNIEYTEENALLHDFTCQECGNIFSAKDNTKLLKEFEKNLDKLGKEMEILNEEINKEKMKFEKGRIKEEEKVKKKKTEERRIAREVLKKEKAKMEINAKKPSKKSSKNCAKKKKIGKNVKKKSKK